MSTNWFGYSHEILLRYEPKLAWKDIELLEKKERFKVRRTIQTVAWKIVELIIPYAQLREEKEKEAQNEEKKRLKIQAERELLLLKMKWTQDEKLLVALPEDAFYYTLYVMYVDSIYVKEKFRKQLSESIKRAKHIGKLRSFATEMNEIELLLECLPKEERIKMIAAIRKSTAIMFNRPKSIGLPNE